MATTTGRRRPAITMTRSDHQSLSRLTESRAARDPDMSEQLLAELDRARVVEDRRIAADVVRVGSTLRFTTDAGEDRTVTLVFPGEADIAMGKVSVLTPIGAALIGLSASQSIDWTSRDGRIHRLTVERVEQTDVAQPARPQPELRTA
ncbi:nucleoside diphosphate kinase regulator [Mesorhizobium sp. ES1-4]|uniref:nucleoside diphosphate kinase regulator n=1 Tax=Mesorhizobium sp. ES1-4 TaxID=2876627 RepID=UPI001CCDA6EE|nr:nucleoside diphosphate kinase regulator [Mesorhizobium sp. ES1-4]MBZ9799073.1 nucleoside diphosphate kinase regulator [Mesorhizobium sp. ES1-4]